MQSACELLRRTARFLSLATRLKEQSRPSSRDATYSANEMAKMAYTLSELQALGEDMDLSGVDVVDAEQPRILEVSLYCIPLFSNVSCKHSHAYASRGMVFESSPPLSLVMPGLVL